MSEREAIALRFADYRPGFNLLACEDAALPFEMIFASAILQERKKVAPVTEFIMRAIHSGLSNIAEISELLGLDYDSVEFVVAELYAADQVDLPLSDGERTLSLTSAGAETVQSLIEIVPVEKEIWFFYDKILLRPSPFRSRQMKRSGDLGIEELIVIPPKHNRNVELSELRVETLNEAVKEAMSADSADVMTIKNLIRHESRYLPCHLLIYESSDSSRHVAEVVIDGRIQSGVGLELERLGIDRHLGISFAAPASRTITEVAHVQEVITKLPEPPVARVKVPLSETDESEDEEFAQSTELHAQQQTEDGPRNLDTFEHRPLLNEALETAKSRLLIVSPWVKGSVVKREFLAQLRRAAERNVKIHIGYGEDPYASGSHADVLSRLHKFAEEFPNVVVGCLGNTHAKTLIWDQNRVSTSFNWLSFQGDKDRTYRQETGLLIRGSNRATEDQWKHDARAIEEVAQKKATLKKK